jgi:hypothetical protein
MIPPDELDPALRCAAHREVFLREVIGMLEEEITFLKWALAVEGVVILVLIWTHLT